MTDLTLEELEAAIDKARRAPVIEDSLVPMLALIRRGTSDRAFEAYRAAQARYEQAMQEARKRALDRALMLEKRKERRLCRKPK